MDFLSDCKTCGALLKGDFHKLCEEGCPSCGSHNTEIYGVENE